MKFLVPNYSWLQNPWLGGLPPPDPLSLCPLSSTEFVEPPSPPIKIPGYATAINVCEMHLEWPMVLGMVSLRGCLNIMFNDDLCY